MRARSSTDYPLLWAYLYLSGGCNLCCAHCWITPDFVAKDGGDGEFLSTADVDRVIRQARPLGLSHVKLTGGEPFINPRIHGIIELIFSNNLAAYIETNATLIDRDTATFLKNNGAPSVSVSLDSHRPSFHDAFRGVAGAFDRTVAGIEHLVAEKIPVQIIMSLVRDNASDIQGLMEMAVRLKVRSFKINPVNPIGRGSAIFERGQTLAVGELIDLCRWVEEDLSRHYGIDTFFTIPSAFKPIGHLFDARSAQCRIHTIIGILADGGISICGIGREAPSLVMGNIKTDDLAVIWRESPILREMREAVPDRLEGICGRCIMKGTCLGSCRADTYVLSGSLSAPHWICREAHREGLFPPNREISR